MTRWRGGLLRGQSGGTEAIQRATLLFKYGASRTLVLTTGSCDRNVAIEGATGPGDLAAWLIGEFVDRE